MYCNKCKHVLLYIACVMLAWAVVLSGIESVVMTWSRDSRSQHTRCHFLADLQQHRNTIIQLGVKTIICNFISHLHVKTHPLMQVN